MKNLSRVLATAALVAASVASHAAVVMTTSSLTGNVAITGFADTTPNTFTITYSDLDGTVTLNNLPAGNYNVSVQGAGSFTGYTGPGGTIGGSIANPLAIFSGFLSNSGLQLPTYNFTFAPGVTGLNTTGPSVPIAFSTSYNGEMAADLFSAVNGMFGNVFVDPTGAGTLDIVGTVYTDGMVLNVTETANWFYNQGFAGVLRALDTQLGGGNGTIDGPFSLTNVTVTATAVPEPASLALVGVGLLGLVAMRRRRTSAHG